MGERTALDQALDTLLLDPYPGASVQVDGYRVEVVSTRPLLVEIIPTRDDPPRPDVTKRDKA